MYLVKTPFLLKWYYPNLIWNKNRNAKVVYLTFDDGPIPNVTDFVLKTLDDFNIKATFFCIGDNIQKHPYVFEHIKNAGHAIGNHTFNHLKGWETDDNTYLSNSLKCQEITKTNLFRPPYGRIKKSQIKKLKSELISNNKGNSIDLEIIMWDVLSGDFDTNIDGETCFKNVIKHTENGSIIVFHDSLKAWDRLQYALPKTIAYLLDKGFVFKTL